MSSEKLQILTMVKENKITVDEGVRLLDAIEKSNQNMGEIPYNYDAKWIKIKVLDSEDNTKTNITLPVSLLSIGVKLAEKFSPEFKASGLTQSDLDEIFAAIKSGVTGKIVDIETDKGEKVEVIIE